MPITKEFLEKQRSRLIADLSESRVKLQQATALVHANQGALAQVTHFIETFDAPDAPTGPQAVPMAKVAADVTMEAEVNKPEQE